MIKSIEIKNIASFSDEEIIKIENLKKINFFYGSNGTGKTTISKIIANDDNSQFADCKVNWDNDIVLEKRIFNKEFVEVNFKEELKGVFTLGEENIDIKNKIKDYCDKIRNNINIIKALRIQLEGENGAEGIKLELQLHEDKFEKIFWKQEKENKEKMAHAFQGYMGSMRDFKNKILKEQDNDTELLSKKEIEKQCDMIFTSVPPILTDKIKVISFDTLLDYEKRKILSKKVVGQNDIDIAKMMKKLDNTDWVREGKNYLESNNNVCPFCQQKVTENFIKNLSEYFNDEFENDISNIKNLLDNYKIESERILNTLQELVKDITKQKYIEKEDLEKEIILFEKIKNSNIQKIEKKQKEPSREIALDGLINIVNAIKVIIDNANKKIDENNDIAKNINKARNGLISKVWRYIVNELKDDISFYRTEKNKFENTIRNLENKIVSNENDKQNNIAEKNKLQKNITDITPTLNAINDLLKKFGFNNFKLSKYENNYKVERENGENAFSTLSEGERNFVVFLYFYHLIKGSFSESDIENDMVVVIDDPVSSLDNDILFIVSTLIRNLWQGNDLQYIKQFFILTHNVYFHKEVSFVSGRKEPKRENKPYFYIVRKQNNNSVVDECGNENPIQTTYDLLWAEIRADKSKRNNATICNTMRRILEHYFQLLGGIDLDNLYKEFDDNGQEQIICKSLLSWINEESHIITDDFNFTVLDENTTDRYLGVFKKIFEKENQIGHYNMMMKIKEDEEDKIELAKEEMNNLSLRAQNKQVS